MLSPALSWDVAESQMSLLNIMEAVELAEWVKYTENIKDSQNASDAFGS